MPRKSEMQFQPSDSDHARKKLKTTGKPSPRHSNPNVTTRSRDVSAMAKAASAIPKRAAGTTFLSLPRELRDIIYDFAVNYDGFQNAIRLLNRRFEDPKTALLSHRYIPKLLQTPGILLANHQIYEEAGEILRKQTLWFKEPLLAMDFDGMGLHLNNVIFIDTLEQIGHVGFDLEIRDRGSCTEIERNGLRDHTVGNWTDDASGNHFLLFSDAWAVLLVNCLNIWLEKSHLENLEVVIRDSHGNKRMRISPENDKVGAVYRLLFSVILILTRPKLSAFKAAVFDSWGSQCFTPLITFLVNNSIPDLPPKCPNSN
jgi:hypothetical protein